MSSTINTSENGKEQWIYILKCLACVLITNSHCREIYPWFFLAVGGGFGNSIFFSISGYLLVNIKDNFVKWYWKRCKRILPAMILILLTDILLIDGIRPFIFWVNKYWFVFAILLYYFVYYWIWCWKSERIAIISFLCWLIGYIVLYFSRLDLTVFSIELDGFSWFKVYFYFGLIIIGGILKRKKECILQNRIVSKISGLILVLSIFLWCGIYAAITVLGICLRVQFLIHFAVLSFAFFMVIFAWNLKIENCPTCVRLLSESTLEIYLVQVTFGIFAGHFKFPINWLCFWSLAMFGGVAMHLFLKKIEFIKGRCLHE